MAANEKIDWGEDTTGERTDYLLWDKTLILFPHYDDIDQKEKELNGLPYQRNGSVLRVDLEEVMAEAQKKVDEGDLQGAYDRVLSNFIGFHQTEAITIGDSEKVKQFGRIGNIAPTAGIISETTQLGKKVYQIETDALTYVDDVAKIAVYTGAIAIGTATWPAFIASTTLALLGPPMVEFVIERIRAEAAEERRLRATGETMETNYITAEDRTLVAGDASPQDYTEPKPPKEYKLSGQIRAEQRRAQRAKAAQRRAEQDQGIASGTVAKQDQMPHIPAEFVNLIRAEIVQIFEAREEALLEEITLLKAADTGIKGRLELLKGAESECSSLLDRVKTLEHDVKNMPKRIEQIKEHRRRFPLGNIWD